MSSIPPSIHDTAAAFDQLPGVGPRAALRYAFWLAGQPKDLIRRFARTLEALSEGVRQCDMCGAWSEGARCSICSDPQRDPTALCIVATSQDVRVIEDSGAFRGRYHILGGVLDPIEGRTPETLRIPQLLDRLREPATAIREIILALDPDVSGDTTTLYLMRQLASYPVTVSRLARGIQHGAQIEYADGVTIAEAIQNRRPLEQRKTDRT